MSGMDRCRPTHVKDRRRGTNVHALAAGTTYICRLQERQTSTHQTTNLNRLSLNTAQLQSTASPSTDPLSTPIRKPSNPSSNFQYCIIHLLLGDTTTTNLHLHNAINSSRYNCDVKQHPEVIAVAACTWLTLMRQYQHNQG